MPNNWCYTIISHLSWCKFSHLLHLFTFDITYFTSCGDFFHICDSFYTPPHKKWRGIMLYPPSFECPSVRRPSVRLSVSSSFLCSNFSTFWPIFFKLCIDIGVGEEWYEVASGLISFWNNRIMAIDVCQKCFALRFRALTVLPFYWFSSNFALTLISERSDMELQVR